MKRKITLYFIAIVAMAFYFGASNRDFMYFHLNKENNKKRPLFLRNDRQVFGDLYGLSFLSDYRSIIPETGKYSPPEKSEKKKSEGDLWIIGDSFLQEMFNEKKSARLFQTDVKDFYWFGYTDQNPPRWIKLDTCRKNVLLIEMTERMIRHRFRSEYIVNSISNAFTTDSNVVQNAYERGIVEKRIIPTSIEQNLEKLFFGYQMFEGIKGVKSGFFYSAFNRADRAVFVCPEKDRLFVRASIDTLQISSSFQSIPDYEIDDIVREMNRVAAQYKKNGFSEVIICIIPNAASICPPPFYRYNNLIPRLQNNKILAVKMIDIYGAMMRNSDPCQLYWKGDSHWNVEGYLIWEQRCNDFLRTIYSIESQ